MPAMMKLLVFSDSHTDVETMDSVVRAERPGAMIIRDGRLKCRIAHF